MNRQCGDCQLCCKLLPVVGLTKAGVRCQHQRHGKGCMIYSRRPMPCRLWSCRWLNAGRTEPLRRPDRSHYVIDVMPDVVTLEPHDGSPTTNIQVIQVWVDPDYPDAHRDPELRAYLEGLAQAALVRFDSQRAIMLFPPALSSDRGWHEVDSNMQMINRTHQQQEQVLDFLLGKNAA